MRATVGLHAAGLAVLALAPGRWPQVLAALVANHAVVSAAGLLPRSRVLGPVLHRLDDTAAVALTFDDGPDPEVTPRVLDRLTRASARASFFLIADRARRHPGLVAAMVAAGHRVENHTDTHPHGFAFYGPRRIDGEIGRAQTSLAELAGVAPVYFRAPAGVRNPFVERALAPRGLVTAAWTRRGFDTVDQRPAAVASRVLRGLRAGDVLLFHDGRGRGGGNPIVLEVLDRALPAIAAAGLAAVPLPRPDLAPSSGRDSLRG